MAQLIASNPQGWVRFEAESKAGAKRRKFNQPISTADALLLL
jgi:hypothetical protein